MAIATIRRQAEYLAEEHRKTEPDMKRVFWFPDTHEVRYLGLLPSMPITGDGVVHAFYFRANPEHELPAPTHMALIRPEEFGKLRLPSKWGDWADAVEIKSRGKAKSNGRTRRRVKGRA